MNKILCFYILLMGFVTGYAQKASIPFQETISRKQAIEDLDTLAYSLREMHPAPFQNNSEKAFNKTVKGIEESLPETISILDFYKSLKPLTAMFKEGHTFLNFPYEDMEKYNVPVFPLAITVKPGKHTIYSAKDYYVNDKLLISKGTQILSINDKRGKSLINQLLKYGEGERDFFRCIGVEQLFTEHLYMLYPDTVFHLKLKTKKGIEYKTIKAVSYSKHQKSERSPVPPYYSCKQLDNNTMFMTLNMCMPGSDPVTFIDSMFQIIKEKNIHNLIIDIRTNPGGYSNIVDSLLRYITHVPFQQCNRVVCKYSTPMKIISKKYGTNLDSIPNGLEEIRVDEFIHPHDHSKHFNGKTYLLTSHMTFSSAADLSWTFKYFKMGTIIGEETGGMNVCCGEVFIQQLPHSQITYGIPCKIIYQYGADDRHIHGTLPDIKISQEKALEKALQLIATESVKK